MPGGRPELSPGTLWRRVVERTDAATKSHALQPIRTEQRIVEQHGVRFLVRVVSSLARKFEDREMRAAETRTSESPANPFLPYDDELFVADLSETHVCVLNKFNVIDHHLLIVTRDFEDQETLLNRHDFEALWACMAEFEGLGFYNGGATAGASQPHKHLQIVPLPLAPGGPAVPIEPLLNRARADRSATSIEGLPFRHAFAWLDTGVAGGTRGAAQASLARYREMMGRVGLEAIDVGGEPRQSGPYNLLLSREWMLLVPRSREFYRTISVNALGFAGSFFVRDGRAMRTIERTGPMDILLRVAAH